MKHLILIITISLMSLAPSFGQNLAETDSIQVCKITNNFFDWYINAISGKVESVFQPRFIESTDGMTTLDFKEYFENLKKHNFSDKLIEKEKDSYNDCLENIEIIKYSDFKTQFTDLDQFENIGCDFENYYRWTGGQEPIQGIRIKKVLKKSKNRIIVIVEYFFDNGGSYGLTYWGNNNISFQRINGDWKIDNIDWRCLN